MQPGRIFETVLYAEDLPAAEQFYHGVLGLEVISQSELCLAFKCRVLLVFDPRKSGAPNRNVPSHGKSGPGHVAFAAKPEELESWKQRLGDAGVVLEAEIQWEEGGRSIYFRDPGDSSVELAPPTLWGGGWEF